MVAGNAQLSWLEARDPFAQLEELAGRIADGICAAVRAAGIPAVGVVVGSMFGVFFREEIPRSFEEAKASDAKAFALFHRGMIERGVFLAPSPFEAGFVSTVHGEGEVEYTLAAAAEAAELAARG
jgi:glutamate-1-semialdehyde 2,1-aminomutase